MTVIATDHLIHNYINQESLSFESQKETIIKPITQYFTKHNPLTLQTLLLTHGLFQPDKTHESTIKDWIKHDLSSLVHQHFEQLKKEWQGPDVNLFIFPVDFDNKTITDSFNGVTGLSFADHILLFLDHQATKPSINAVLAHEYSHSFRLKTVHNQHNLITLKDTIILEGIAEVITLKKYNISFLSKNKANKQVLKNQFNKWIKPNLSIQTNHPLHQFIMYGGNQLDDRMGYKVGTYLVNHWLAKHQVDIPTLLRQPTESFFEELE